MNMIKILTLSTLIAGPTAIAQSPETGPMEREAIDPEVRLQIQEVMRAQREKVEALMEEEREYQRDQMEARRQAEIARRDENRARQEALRDQIEDIRNEGSQELEGILTPEQFTQAQLMMNRARMQRNSSRSDDRRPGPQNSRQPRDSDRRR